MRIFRAVVSGAAVLGGAALVAVGVGSCGSSSQNPAGKDSATAHVVGPSKEEMGKYIMRIGGCADCHTPGVMQGLNTPESEWWTGVPVGWRGPWGTTYAPNLRKKIKPYVMEKMFVDAMRKRDTRPPMPWPALHAMTDEDLGAVWAYIRSLPDAGVDMPDPVPAGMEPKTPYLSMDVVMPGGAGGMAPAGGGTQPAK